MHSDFESAEWFAIKNESANTHLGKHTSSDVQGTKLGVGMTKLDWSVVEGLKMTGCGMLRREDLTLLCKNVFLMGRCWLLLRIETKKPHEMFHIQ